MRAAVHTVAYPVTLRGLRSARYGGEYHLFAAMTVQFIEADVVTSVARPPVAELLTIVQATSESPATGQTAVVLLVLQQYELSRNNDIVKTVALFPVYVN